MQRRRLIAALSGVLLAVGCGGDDDSSSGAGTENGGQAGNAAEAGGSGRDGTGATTSGGGGTSGAGDTGGAAGTADGGSGTAGAAGSDVQGSGGAGPAGSAGADVQETGGAGAATGEGGSAASSTAGQAGAAGADEPSGGTGAAAGSAGAPPADPVDVAVELDQARAVSATIPTEGGSITAVAADGSELTLTVPPDALLSPEEITLTPVASVADLPFSDGLVAAAHFEPEGLLLLQPATLTITLPSAIPATELIGFGYTAQGQDFHLAPMYVDGATLTFPIAHFSGAGSGRGNDGDAGGQAGRPPTSPQDQATQTIASILRQAQARDGDLTPDELDAIGDALQIWFTTSVMPNLRAAEGNDAVLEAALSELIAWYDRVLSFGLEGRFADDWADALASARIGLLNAIRRSHERCVSGPDASEVVTILKWGQIGVLLGVLDFPEFSDDVQACARFELDVTSRFVLIDDPSSDGTVQVHRLLLTLGEGLIEFTGSGPADYSSASFDYECTVSFVPVSSTADVAMTMNLNFKESHDAQIQMFFWPGTPMETLIVQCPDDDTPHTQVTTYWYAGWLAGHQAEFESTGMVDWEFSGGSWFAHKLYAGLVSEEGVEYQETTSLDLYHTPQ